MVVANHLDASISMRYFMVDMVPSPVPSILKQLFQLLGGRSTLFRPTKIPSDVKIQGCESKQKEGSTCNVARTIPETNSSPLKKNHKLGKGILSFLGPILPIFRGLCWLVTNRHLVPSLSTHHQSS